MRLILSCEHATNAIPKPYAYLFHAKKKLLASHAGLDIGAEAMTRHLASKLRAPYLCAKQSRLLIDLNRSLHHPRCFSPCTRTLDGDTKKAIIEDIYTPYRQRFEHMIMRELATHGQVVHISVHSFTPVLNHSIRHADIGLLYDPSRKREVKFCDAWRSSFCMAAPDKIVRRNYPYRGTSDGFVTYLRQQFKANQYLGIELEINQRLLLKQQTACAMADVITTSLKQILFT